MGRERPDIQIVQMSMLHREGRKHQTSYTEMIAKVKDRNNGGGEPVGEGHALKWTIGCRDLNAFLG